MMMEPGNLICRAWGNKESVVHPGFLSVQEGALGLWPGPQPPALPGALVR